MTRYQQSGKRTWIKWTILTAFVGYVSFALYHQEGIFEIKNFSLWLVYLILASLTLLHGLRRRVEFREYSMFYQNLFQGHEWNYEDITEVERYSTRNRNNANSNRQVYYDLTNKQGKKIRIPWSIFKKDSDRFEFLIWLEEKNPSIQFDYVCRTMLGKQDVEVDIKKAFQTVFDLYQKEKKSGE